MQPDALPPSDGEGQAKRASPAVARGVLDHVVGTANAAAGVILLALMVLITTAVVSRQLLGRPMAWVIELSGIALLFITFLSTAYVARLDGHVRVDLLNELLPASVMWRLSVVAEVLQIAIAAVLAYAGARLALDHLGSGVETSGFLSIPRWTVDVVIPLGAGLLVMQLFASFSSRLEAQRPVQRPEGGR